MQTPAARRRFHWVGLCLSLLMVAACSTTPAPSSLTPTASVPVQAATISAYHGHTSTVFAVAWSPDGIRMVSGGNDNTLQVWNAITGKRLLTYTGHLGSIWAVVWSPDGRCIASGGNDGTVQVGEASGGHRFLTFRRHTGPVRGVAWSPDGRHIASATGNTSDEHPRESVQVWKAKTWQLLISYAVPSSAIYSDGTLGLAWSPDSTRFVSGGAGTTVHLWKAPASCS